MSDFINLTRGRLCGCTVDHPHYLRVQSTHCEQKLWYRVLETTGPDLLEHFAVGADVVLHDFSEKPRMTRALWQGLPWVRYACERAWGGEPAPVTVRNGMNVTAYFEEVYQDMPLPLLTWVRYFGKHWGGEPITYETCPAAAGQVAA